MRLFRHRYVPSTDGRCAAPRPGSACGELRAAHRDAGHPFVATPDGSCGHLRRCGAPESKHDPRAPAAKVRVAPKLRRERAPEVRTYTCTDGEGVGGCKVHPRCWLHGGCCVDSVKCMASLEPCRDPRCWLHGTAPKCTPSVKRCQPACTEHRYVLAMATTLTVTRKAVVTRDADGIETKSWVEIESWTEHPPIQDFGGLRPEVCFEYFRQFAPCAYFFGADYDRTMIERALPAPLVYRVERPDVRKPHFPKGDPCAICKRPAGAHRHEPEGDPCAICKRPAAAHPWPNHKAIGDPCTKCGLSEKTRPPHTDGREDTRPRAVYWNAPDSTRWRLNYIRDCWRVARVGAFDESKRRSVTIGKEVSLYDVKRFYQGSFVQALEDWRVGTSWDRAVVAAKKVQRDSFDTSDGHEWEQVVRYCRLETRLGAELVRRLYKAHDRAEITLPRDVHGAGTTAGAIMKKHDVMQWHSVPRNIPAGPHPSEGDPCSICARPARAHPGRGAP